MAPPPPHPSYPLRNPPPASSSYAPMAPSPSSAPYSARSYDHRFSTLHSPASARNHHPYNSYYNQSDEHSGAPSPSVNVSTVRGVAHEDSSPSSHAGTPGSAAGTADRGVEAGPKKVSSRSKTSSKDDSTAQIPGQEAGDSSSGPKRKKKAVSCENCRRRKLKCDRGWPCGACRDRDEAHLCTWEGGTKPQAPGRDQGNAPLLTRMERLENLLGHVAVRLGIGLDEADNSPQDYYGSDDTGKRQREPGEEIPSVSSTSTKKQRRGSGFDGTISRFLNPTRSEEVRPYSLSALHWVGPSFEESRAELFKLMEMLPDTGTVRRMSTFFFEEVGWVMHVVDEEDFWQRALREHEELRLMWQSAGPYMHSRLGPQDNVRGHLQFLSLLMSMCGFAMMSASEELSDLPKLIDGKPAYGHFFEGASRAFNASSPFDEPTLNSLRAVILLTWTALYIRGTSVSAALCSLAIGQMQALELDVEPPPTMSRSRAKDRLGLFITMAILDWSSSGSLKRSHLLQEEPIKMPYLFKSRTYDFHNYDDEKELVSRDVRIFLEIARLNRRASERQAMNEERAYETTVQIQADIDSLYMSTPLDYETLMQNFNGFTKTNRRHVGLLCGISTTLIKLHKNYYIQGWLDPAFCASKEICFVSSRRICALFRKAFATELAIDRLMAMGIDELRYFMEERPRFTQKLGLFSHASISALLLLRHHIAMMEAHPSMAGPNADEVRGEIMEDISITMRLLLAISSRHQTARTGVEVLSDPKCEAGYRSDVSGLHTKSLSDPSVVHGGADDESISRRKRELATDLRSITGIENISHSSSTLPNRGTYSQPHQKSTDNAVAGGSYGLSDCNNDLAALLGGQDIQTFLDGAWKTDTGSGQPVAPELSFERQADRIGGQSIMPGALIRPMSPFTSAFLGSLENFQAMTSSGGPPQPPEAQQTGEIAGGGYENSNGWY